MVGAVIPISSGMLPKAIHVEEKDGRLPFSPVAAFGILVVVIYYQSTSMCSVQATTVLLIVVVLLMTMRQCAIMIHDRTQMTDDRSFLKALHRHRRVAPVVPRGTPPTFEHQNLHDHRDTRHHIFYDARHHPKSKTRVHRIWYYVIHPTHHHTQQTINQLLSIHHLQYSIICVRRILQLCTQLSRLSQVTS